MAKIEAVGTAVPPYTYSQKEIIPIVEHMFSDAFPDIGRLLSVFENGLVNTRSFAQPLSWYLEEHSFADKNRCFQEAAFHTALLAAQRCLENHDTKAVDAIFFVTSTGIKTPGLEVDLIDALSLSGDIERYPLWGLGCAGGVSGINKALQYCDHYPDRVALLVCVEMCSTTFQKDDHSKSNLIGTSLFADGAACALVSGKRVKASGVLPHWVSSYQSLQPQSQKLMGWNVENDGLHVIFGRQIPSVVKSWVVPELTQFLQRNNVSTENIVSYISHPGGRKVLEAYEESFQVDKKMFSASYNVLQKYGNMSSPTVLFVLQEIMKQPQKHGNALMTALGPGFSSDAALLEWRDA
ncbi:type III polyketide synthase [Aureibacillus halotolerans]|uniref:15-methylpalmitoyl-4-hydroxy-2-pyrone synthase n=1 Tax=Aureibacillus halotolerans TaxID=1508390 RepID=A0A4R6U931_9BACI|nr:3-oxoacyl-[acyl-carrier-protein] synthase III C-terminal domain-containing protein [Aureibacillus halotolerans]TDQ41473.1 15-methylpalmitoyl-4-hydroxy-2-pyrone synthase [Aureibacillus halotolerans]